MAETAESKVDALFRVVIEHEEAMQALEDIADELHRLNGTAENIFDRIDSKVQQVGQQAGETAHSETSGFAGMGAIIGLVGGIAGSVFTAMLNQLGQLKQAIQAYIKEAINLSRTVETQREILYTLGNAQGYARKEMDTFIEGMRETGITTRASIQVLNLMVEQQLDLAKATDLARVAQNRGRIAGLNSSETTERILFAITNLNTVMLKSIGIHVSTEKAYNDYARSVGKASGAALTFEERQKAVLSMYSKVMDGGALVFTVPIQSAFEDEHHYENIRAVQTDLSEIFEGKNKRGQIAKLETPQLQNKEWAMVFVKKDNV